MTNSSHAHPSTSRKLRPAKCRRWSVSDRASRVATAKMLDYYKRMGIRVTPQMTLAPEPVRKKRGRRA
ncbi:MAG: hypothetical protein IPK32_26280 [Verrucomicrobiaceae bacterium]|nr:hypothetical protein [Verrucomicrobiaceae bacterium]